LRRTRVKTKRYAVGLGLAAAALLGIVAASLVRAPAQVADDPVGVLEAVHYAWSGSAYDIPVEPSTGEHVRVTVTFAQPPPGAPMQVVGWVDVDWNGSSWVLSNAYAPTGIAGYTICDAEACGSQVDSHGYGYKLQVMTQPPPGSFSTHLVEFLVSSVDDGYTLTGSPCDEDTVVSNPPPYVFGVTDTGPFETLPDCANSGASLAIPYE
jgi:hypothetical protein